MDHLVRRMQGHTSTVFAEMTALARSTGAVNLGQGFPDGDGPAGMLEAAVAAIRGGQNQYPPGRGVPVLREAVARHQREHYDLDLDPDREVLVTVGATEAVAAALLALCEPGDEVVVLEPFYDSYAACVALAGAVLRPVPLRPPELRFDPDELRAAFSARTRVVLLNTPHNPTGRVLEAEEMAQVAALAAEHHAVVVTDEVYEHLVFDGGRHIPMATLPGMAARTLTVSSAGKSFACTGWKVGWVSGPADLVDAVLAVKQYLTFVGSGPFQPAVAHALDAEREFLATQRRDLQRRRDRLCDGLAASGWRVLRPQGTYFVLADARGLGYEDGEALCRRLPELAGVVGVPVAGFSVDPTPFVPWVRFAFCKTDEVLGDGLRRLSGLGRTGETRASPVTARS